MSNIKSEIDKWYENYIDELFAYGIAFGVEKDFVLDAIHDLFLHLFESADKIEILGSPKSYLFSALKNKIITSLRKQANWLSLEEEVEYNFKIEVDAEALMEDEEERRNYEKEVESLLNLLTNKQREVIYLRFIKALSIQEISEILNITPKSVRKMIYRAIERMQQGKIELLPLFSITNNFLYILTCPRTEPEQVSGLYLFDLDRSDTNRIYARRHV